MRIRSTALLLLVACCLAGGASAQPVEETAPPVLQDSLVVADSLPPESPDSLGSPELPAVPVEAPPAETLSVDPGDPSSVLTAYFEALQTGNAETVVAFTSSEALEGVATMLEGLRESLDRDEAGTSARMASSGYTATPEEIGDWSPADYLAAAVTLAMMKNRYLAYSMEILEYEPDEDEVVIPVGFRTAAGALIPFEVRMVREDGVWAVSSFLGLNSFP